MYGPDWASDWPSMRQVARVAKWPHIHIAPKSGPGWSNIPLWFAFARAVGLGRVSKINKTSQHA
jgi:hypothetical protein